MNQGGYGGGGGWGQPPGGAPPGGYGPPGGGYGQPPGAPPGGGYGQPPGAPPGGGYGQPPGGGSSGGMERFMKPAMLGGLIGGVLCSIPLLNIINYCFCVLNMIGAMAAVSFYLKDNPNERLKGGDAAMCGGIAGAIAGVIAGILGLLISLTIGAALAGLTRSVPGIGNLAFSGFTAVIMIPVYALIYGGFGALGGFLSMQMFFKDRLIP